MSAYAERAELLALVIQFIGINQIPIEMIESLMLFRKRLNAIQLMVLASYLRL